MLFIDSRTNKISMTKGDNASIEVVLEERQIFEDDVITMTVRNKNEGIAFTKTAVDGVIEIEPEDTKDLDTDEYYYYDIQLTTFGGQIYTIVEDALFSVNREVTR